MSNDASTARQDYITGLRMLADLLEQNPDVKLPYDSGAAPSPARRVTLYFLHSRDPKADLTRFARLLPGRVDKEFSDNTFSVVGRLAGLHIEATAYRDAVCERVVTGTRTVTTMVPDPNWNGPMVEQTDEVEDVEWVCHPLLAETAEQVST
jgi:hypothetical protein